MDLTMNVTEFDHPKSENGSAYPPIDRNGKLSKADRLDSIVGDVLARQCKVASENLIVSPVSHEESILQHHHHDLSDDVPPTEVDIPLHEWVTALTHPVLGPYPNGVTPRILDRLAAEAGVTRFPDYARRRWHKMWSSSNHLCVYLSDEVKCGRLRRVRFGHYAGCFDEQTAFRSVNTTSAGTESGTNKGIDQCATEATSENTSVNQTKEEGNDYFGSVDPGVTAGRSFPIMALTGHTRDRTSSFTSQNGGRKRNFRSAFSNSNLDEAAQEKQRRSGVHKAAQPRNQRTNHRNDSIVLDEFGLPSLLEDPTFSSSVISIGLDVQSWSVGQSAAFIQDFGFRDGAEAFVREEIDGTALMLLRRADVLDGLRLKIGPAVKLYRYIRALQKLVCRKNENQSESSNGD